MNCTRCGTALAPGSGFCGACGTSVAPAPPPGQPQWQQPPGAPPQGQWQPPPPQPPQGQWQPPPPQGQWQQPPQGMQGPPGMAMQPHGGVQIAPPQPGGYLRPFPLVMQQRMTRLTGHMFLAPQRLIFICQSTKGGLGMALGRGLGGIAGMAIAAAFTPTPGQPPPVFDEPTLLQMVGQHQGSVIMIPQQIKAIKCTMWWRAIWFNGLTYALPDGLSKDLKRELGMWCNANQVKNKGLG